MRFVTNCRRNLLHGHGWTVAFLVDVSFLPQGSTLPLQHLHPFAVNLNTAGTGLRKRVALEDPAHVMKQSIYAEEYVGRQMFVLPPQKGICMFVNDVRL